jgi:hypothetical protein
MKTSGGLKPPLKRVGDLESAAPLVAEVLSRVCGTTCHERDAGGGDI